MPTDTIVELSQQIVADPACRITIAEIICLAEAVVQSRTQDKEQDKEIAFLKSEVKRLRKIVGKLPKTADGVPALIGMTFYYHSPAGIIETEVINDWGELAGMFTSDLDEFQARLYSSRKAAEAGRK
jgi:hypothetical protein